MPGRQTPPGSDKPQETRKPQQKHQMKVSIARRAGVEPLYRRGQILIERSVGRLLRQGIAQKFGQEKGYGGLVRIKGNRRQQTVGTHAARPQQTRRSPRLPVDLNQRKRLEQTQRPTLPRRLGHTYHKRHAPVGLRKHIGYDELIVIFQGRQHQTSRSFQHLNSLFGRSKLVKKGPFTPLSAQKIIFFEKKLQKIWLV